MTLRQILMTDLGLNGRAWNILKNNEILNVDALCALRESDLLRLPGCGKVSVEEIKMALARHGRYLGDIDDPWVQARAVRSAVEDTGWT